MIVANGSTDVTTYFVLRDSTKHAPKTDVTITDIDLYYLEQGAAMAAKVDATALAAADSAHADNKGYHTGQGLYRIDWPDEAFNGGVGKRAYLIVVCTGVDTTFLEVELSPNVNTNSLTADVITAAGIADNAFANEHFANGALTSTEITSAGGCVVASIANDAITAAAIQNGAIDAATFAANAITSTVIADDAITAAKLNTGAITADAFAANAITNAAVADDVDVNVKTMTAGVITAAVIADGAIDANTFAAGALDAVWSTAARTLTAIDEDNTTLDLDATIEAILAASATIAALPTAAENADAVWDEASTGHTDAGKAGAQMWTDVDAILADTGTDGVKVASFADNSITAAAIADAAIDQATFAADVYVVANVKKINGTTVTGDGGATPWGPA
jgi:ABC-type metal ion transport system substrate-binding protein